MNLQDVEVGTEAWVTSEEKWVRTSEDPQDSIGIWNTTFEINGHTLIYGDKIECIDDSQGYHPIQRKIYWDKAHPKGRLTTGPTRGTKGVVVESPGYSVGVSFEINDECICIEEGGEECDCTSDYSGLSTKEIPCTNICRCPSCRRREN